MIPRGKNKLYSLCGERIPQILVFSLLVMDHPTQWHTQGGFGGLKPLSFQTKLAFLSEVSKLCKCSMCCYFNTAVTKFADIMLKPNQLVGVVVRDIIIHAGRSETWRDASSPLAIFKHDFDECSFSLISNLFDNNKSYALQL